MKEITFEKYLNNRYKNKNTVRQYKLIGDAFEREGHSKNQEGVENFIGRDGARGGDRKQQIYRSFLNNYFKYLDIAVKIPKEKSRGTSTKKIIKFLTYEEITQLIVNLPGILGLMVKLYFETGLRLNELIETRKKDFNLNERTVTGIGKGLKPFKVKYSRDTANWLSDWLGPMDFDEFPFKYSYVKHHKSKFWYDLKKESLVIGIPDVHPHRFRHGLAYYMRAVKGFDLEQIRVKLRHSKLDTVQIYAEATQKEVDDKMDKEVFEDE